MSQILTCPSRSNFQLAPILSDLVFRALYFFEEKVAFDLYINHYSDLWLLAKILFLSKKRSRTKKNTEHARNCQS